LLAKPDLQAREATWRQRGRLRRRILGAKDGCEIGLGRHKHENGSGLIRLCQNSGRKFRGKARHFDDSALMWLKRA
jgi:hypothetical protein